MDHIGLRKIIGLTTIFIIKYLVNNILKVSIPSVINFGDIEQCWWNSERKLYYWCWTICLTRVSFSEKMWFDDKYAENRTNLKWRNKMYWGGKCVK